MQRIFPKNLTARWRDPKGLIQIFIGPRQVGKTTAATQLADNKHAIFFSADLPAPPTVDLIVTNWQAARKIESEERTLVLDEIQKIPRWSETVKGLWDEDQRNNLKMRVAILGSSTLLIERGLSESLTGRFEINFFPYWTFREIKSLSPNVDLELFTYFGGYPKVYDFIDDRFRGKLYILNSILEPTLGRDILSLHSVEKPALLRQLFWYISKLPARIISYDKILGHLQDRGNSATLVHYAELLSSAFIAVPIYKHSFAAHRTKKSIPKWIIPNSALIDSSLFDAPDSGFIFENLVGGHLLNIFYGNSRLKLEYWRERDEEIDFIVRRDDVAILAIEVKSGRKKGALSPARAKAIGFNCPFLLVSKENALEFFWAEDIEELLRLADDSFFSN